MTHETDPILTVLNNQTRSSGFELSVTLVLDGLIVAGQMVSDTTYFARLVEDPQLESLHEALMTMNAALRDYGQENDTDVHEDFVHLVDATLFPGSEGGVPTEAGMTMRIRLADVSGWSIGALTSAKRSG